MDKEGRVIGITSLRVEGISIGLQNYLKKLSASSNQGSLRIMGIDPLQAAKETGSFVIPAYGPQSAQHLLQHFMRSYLPESFNVQPVIVQDLFKDELSICRRGLQGMQIIKIRVQNSCPD